MAQGIFGGMTNYEDQSIDDIIEDIKAWIIYSKDIKIFLEEGIEVLKEKAYWNKVPFNFQTTLLTSIRSQTTFLHDLELILNAIKQEKLSLREIKLMKKIGINSIEYNIEFGKSYKEESGWKEYSNKDFKIVESLYAKGRDYFITMQDASNVSARLSDYINTIPQFVNQSVHQTIHGSGHTVVGYNQGVINKTDINTSHFSKDVESALIAIDSTEDLDSNMKKHIIEILKESEEAVKQGDLDTQSNSKTKMKSFLIGAGVNASKLVQLLGTYASIASYYEF